MFFCNRKFRKEIETLIFLRNLSNIVIAAICWQMTGSKKKEILDAEKEHNRSNNGPIGYALSTKY